MRIGNNNQGIWQFLSNKSFPFAGKQGNVSKGNEKAIADLLSGRRKNSYGVEGMRITGRTDWKRVINVSDEIFADESITSMVSGEAKGLDMRI